MRSGAGFGIICLNRVRYEGEACFTAVACRLCWFLILSDGTGPGANEGEYGTAGFVERVVRARGHRLSRPYSEYCRVYPCGGVGRGVVEAASGGEGAAGRGDVVDGDRGVAVGMEEGCV